MKPSALLCVLFALVLPHVSSLELTEELLEHMRAQGVFPASAQKAAELTDEQYAQLNRDLDAVEKTCAGAPQSWNLIDLRARIITNAVEQPDSANGDDKVPQQMPELVLSVRQFNPNVVLPPREEDDGGDERPLSFPGLQEEPSVPPPRQAQRVDDGAEASFIEAETSSKLRAKAGESITSEQAGKCEADALAVLAKAGIDSETIIVERPLRTVDESGMIPRFVSMLETEAARVWRKYDVLHGGIMSGGAESYKAGGTLGAILVPEDLASATPNELKAKVQSLGDKPIFYTLTNQHVYSNADGSPIVQPARRYMEDSYTGANNVCPNAKAEPTPAACQRPIGKKLLSVQNQNDKSKLDQSGKPADSKHKPLMDAAVGAIDRAHHVECKMHGLGGDIKGIDPRGSHNLDPRLAGSSQQGYGIKVTKSGARTGVTTGYVIAVNDGDGPAAFQIVSRSLPKMEGMKDYTVVDRRPFETDWANSYKAEEKEPDYLEAYLCREVATAWGEEFDRLSEERKLRVRTRVANLLHHKLVTAFSMAGDSGSVVLTRNKAMAVFNNGWNVFGLMNSGRSAPYFFDAKYNPDSDDPKLRKPPGRAVWDHVIKRYWRAFPKITWAVSIESVVWAINKELKKRGSSVRLTVCTTARGKMINAALKSLKKNQDQNALNPQ